MLRSFYSPPGSQPFPGFRSEKHGRLRISVRSQYLLDLVILHLSHLRILSLWMSIPKRRGQASLTQKRYGAGSIILEWKVPDSAPPESAYDSSLIFSFPSILYIPSALAPPRRSSPPPSDHHPASHPTSPVTRSSSPVRSTNVKRSAILNVMGPLCGLSMRFC